MNFFSIKDLERFSGIKAHTIRIWEVRYSTLLPRRNEGNTRQYALDDVLRLTSIALLLKTNYKISVLSRLNPAELEHRLQRITDNDLQQEKAIARLIYYMYSDIEQFEYLLDSCTHSWGIDATLKNVVLPLLEKTELLSYKDRNNETHFAITALRRKIIAGIENGKGAPDLQVSALLFLPEGEHYDLMLLYTNYILKQHGIRVLYLGTNVPVKNLKHVLESRKPDFFYTYLPPKKKFILHEFSGYLSNHFPSLVMRVVHCNKAVAEEEKHNTQFIHFSKMAMLRHETTGVQAD